MAYYLTEHRDNFTFHLHFCKLLSSSLWNFLEPLLTFLPRGGTNILLTLSPFKIYLMGKWHKCKKTQRYGQSLPSYITTFWIPLECQVQSVIKLAERFGVGSFICRDMTSGRRWERWNPIWCAQLQVWKLTLDYCQFGYLSPTAHAVWAYVLISCSGWGWGGGALSQRFEKTCHILEHGFLNFLYAVDHFDSLVKPTDRFLENIMCEVKHVDIESISMFYSLCYRL